MTFNEVGETIKTYAEVTEKITETDAFQKKYGETLSSNISGAAGKIEKAAEYGMVLKDCIDNDADFVDTVEALGSKFVKDQISDMKNKGLKELGKMSRTITVYNQVNNAIATYELTYEAGKWGVYAVVSTMPDDMKDKMARSKLGKTLEGVSEGITYWVFENPKNVLENDFMPFVDKNILPAIQNDGLEKFARTTTESVETVLGYAGDALNEAKEYAGEALSKANESILNVGQTILDFFGSWRKPKTQEKDNKDKGKSANGKYSNDGAEGEGYDNGEKEKYNYVYQYVDNGSGYEPGDTYQEGDTLSRPEDNDATGKAYQDGDAVGKPEDDGEYEWDIPFGVPLPDIGWRRLLYLFSGEDIGNEIADLWNTDWAGSFNGIKGSLQDSVNNFIPHLK